MNLRDAVELIAASQGAGRYLCPKCCGGGDGEHSLSIRITDGGIYWKCFRASCEYSGGPRNSQHYAALPRSTKEPRHYTRPLMPLTGAQEALIEARYGINPDELEGYDEIADRFVLGVYGPIGYNKRGVIAYSLSGASPKSLTYNEKPAEPFVHYTGHGGALVIVEDWFSAEKVAATERAVGVAIMGTHLGQAEITEIATIAGARGAPVFVALDRDAYTKTLLYLSKYREQFPRGLYAWSLRQDLKYEPIERIKEALNGKTDFTGDVKRQEYV